MRTCPYCNDPIDEIALFCPHCGREVSTEVTPGPKEEEKKVKPESKSAAEAVGKPEAVKTPESEALKAAVEASPSNAGKAIVIAVVVVIAVFALCVVSSCAAMLLLGASSG